MLVVAAIIAIILGIAVVALRSLTSGTEEGAARTSLRAILASARADAALRQHLVGVRFQQNGKGDTYAVIVYPMDPQPSWATSYPPNCIAFYAPAGREPHRLPRGVELSCGSLRPTTDAEGNQKLQPSSDFPSPTPGLENTTTFMVVFAPNGEIVRKPVCVLERDNADSIFFNPKNRTSIGPGLTRWDLAVKQQKETGLPLRDDSNAYPANLTPYPYYETSETDLWLYDQTARQQAGAQPWTNYLKNRVTAAKLDINPYTGQLRPSS